MTVGNFHVTKRKLWYNTNIPPASKELLMTRYELYRGTILFHTTSCVTEAFRLFNKWTGRGHNVRMKFVRL